MMVSQNPTSSLADDAQDSQYNLNVVDMTTNVMWETVVKGVRQSHIWRLDLYAT